MSFLSSVWKEDILKSISLNLNDMSPWPVTGSMNQRSLKNLSRDYPIPLPEVVWTWTLWTPGKSGKPQHINVKTYIYVGDKSWELRRTKRTSLCPKRKT